MQFNCISIFSNIKYFFYRSAMLKKQASLYLDGQLKFPIIDHALGVHESSSAKQVKMFTKDAIDA